jgi:hypothetical protein
MTHYVQLVIILLPAAWKLMMKVPGNDELQNEFTNATCEVKLRKMRVEEV